MLSAVGWAYRSAGYCVDAGKGQMSHNTASFFSFFLQVPRIWLLVARHPLAGKRQPGPLVQRLFGEKLFRKLLNYILI
jgi:hypothetical protein